ncbi:hypothetical protein [Burkholderia cenocepacia]|uniref:hypothetical protein n=1 Tax=Burkholderia cenocepacia TaxID=95486 RepID=UPI0022EA4655|nr:hypothetical protein [Burkholderia cenocepacia]MDA3669889.1 hypothetical protein [Burkholderia cenocepacia]MDA3679858.1 hypothetical protein [Burkholderia cenocepacia]MDA3687693.1 hypothetical protein [Burkholderia cenocepacia]MDA3694903.1 hypothetical protein [Burkholderia cenocepacia]MDA3702041.1 hypothetical protein [Burkholderia cenocepacia]
MTAYAIVQHSDFKDDVLPAEHDLKFAQTFGTKSQFDTALRGAIAALHCLDDATPKVLIISTHGEELTGTRLDTGTGSVDLWEYKDHFGVLPNNLVVYLSACWGGYPTTAGAIQSGARVPPVVGPLVDIIVSDANAFQAELLDLLDTGMPTTDALNGLIRRYNDDESLRRDDYGDRRWLFGMWDEAGNFHPEAAVGAQLAAPVVDHERLKLVDLVRHGESGEVIACVVEDQRGKRFQANIAPLLDAAGGDPESLVDVQFNAPYQVASDLCNPRDVGITGLPRIHIVE